MNYSLSLTRFAILFSSIMENEWNNLYSSFPCGGTGSHFACLWVTHLSVFLSIRRNFLNVITSEQLQKNRRELSIRLLILFMLIT